jgi:hypothetical protein
MSATQTVVTATTAPATDPDPAAVDVGPPNHATARSTTSTCSQAGTQSGGPTGAVTAGTIAPTIALGYASTSVAVDSGVHRKVSSVPTGCTDPKCAITTGVLTANAAAVAAMARELNSPTICSITGAAWSPRSRGIHASQRARIGGATCRSASTQPKLSWNPAFTDCIGSWTSMAMATAEMTASPFQSRPHACPVAPSAAMSALRMALAAGAMTHSASSAARTTGTARHRSSRSTSPATHATSQPSTERLNPEIARMCARPAARKLPSVGLYPGSTSPSTSATSIGRTPASSGTPASRPSRRRPRSTSRIRASESAIGDGVRHPTTSVARRALSIESEPTRPSIAAISR